ELVSLSLDEFVSTAQELVSSDMDDFTRFVLTGIYDDRQIQVDPIKSTLSNDHGIQALRDYDSLLGLHEDICVQTYLTVYPVSKFEDTLRKNIHIKYSFSNQSGTYTDIPVHTIPNLCIAKWGTHNMIRAVLPGLYNADRRTPFLTKEELVTFYEKGLRPAIESLPGNAAAEWPPSYSAEMFRARGKNGTLSFQTKTLPDWHVRYLGDAIRDALSENNVPWGNGLVFLHQIRGVKSSNGHTPTRIAAYDSLDEFCQNNDLAPNCHAEGHWWVDVGLEISSQQEECLAWRTDSHFHVVKHVLEISDRSAQRITSIGSSKYIRDLTSHLTSVSGCRISPGVRTQGPHKAAYFQMYSTDKSITYRHEGSHHGKFLRGQDILKNKADDYCHDLYELYREAATKNYSLARVEVRVPFVEAADVLVDLDIGIIRRGLVAVDPVVWWTLRAYRLLAFKYILEQQALSDSCYRAIDSALLLTAAAPWFINGIHSTPDNGPASRDLMGKILPTVNRTEADQDTLAYPASTRVRASAVPVEHLDEEEEEEGENAEIVDNDLEDNLSVASGLSDTDEPVPEHRRAPSGRRAETLPHNPYGIVFLRPIRIGKDYAIPRFLDNDVPMITWKTFQYIFGVHRDDLDATFFKAKLVVPSNPRRVPNKVRLTALCAPQEQTTPLFNLSQRGYALQLPVVDRGSDIEQLQSVTQRKDEDIDIDTKLTSMWNQFIYDVTQKAPNRRSASAESYCILTPEQREVVTEAAYQNLHLREFFSDCQYRTATKAQWDSAFDKYWPLDPILVGGAQNFPTMQYYKAWSDLIELSEKTNDEETLTEIRKALRKRFNSLAWIPNAQSDRVWYTRRDHRCKRFPGANLRFTAPRILI
ncbi:hypothetical protein BDN70DRAFT_779560, partial [Pholiota conissans]